MARTSGRRQVVKIQEGERRTRWDRLAPEEPLEVRVCGSSVAVTMRSPGHDFELVAGFLFAEGVVRDRSEIAALRYCVAGGPQQFNVVDAAVGGADGHAVAPLRTVLTSSACGVCGAASIEATRKRGAFDVASDDVRVSHAVLASLPDRMRAAQREFDATGGLHAAALFTDGGELVCLREDVGRHNAFDKVIGRALLDGRLPLRRHVILASGRASFELAQKAALAGIPVLAAVSAPSTLAAELADEAGMTLVGFLRGGAMNVYTGEERIT